MDVISEGGRGVIVEQPRLVYGGLSSGGLSDDLKNQSN